MKRPKDIPFGDSLLLQRWKDYADHLEAENARLRDALRQIKERTRHRMYPTVLDAEVYEIAKEASQQAVEARRAETCHCTGWRHHENGVCKKCGLPVA